MTQEEKIAIAETVRHRDRFGPVSQEELAALPGKETELWIQTKNGYCVHVFEERPEALPDRAPILLNFHGGGFLKGRTDRDRRYCCAVMEATNALVWDVDYSLAPEKPFPYAAEESYGIIQYVFEHAEELCIEAVSQGAFTAYAPSLRSVRYSMFPLTAHLWAVYRLRRKREQ